MTLCGGLLPYTAIFVLFIGLIEAQICPPAIQIDRKPQVFIMSDISNEPDDTMSFIRLLVHADQYNITGLTAVTSTWLPDSVYPDQILDTVKAYGRVVDNLNTHSESEFPSEKYLESVVKAGHPVYGTEAVGRDLSSGAQHLIEVVDSLPEDEVLHCQGWGGVNVLAEALAYVQRTRAPLNADLFVSKLRLYTISDQDNAGEYIRRHFPTIPYIVSLHGLNQYRQAAWAGISGEKYYNFDLGGPDSSLVTEEYVAKNFQIGPLGSLYPDVEYIMEGDSPSLMHTMVNGLDGGPYDHPEWGGWGGRYILLDRTKQSMVYSDVTDAVVGKNNETFILSQATIWRWRQAYQNEMSARIQWTVQSAYSAGSHPPVVIVNDSCGSAPVEFEVEPEETILLDASATYDPDRNSMDNSTLQFDWFHYRDITSDEASLRHVPKLNFTLLEGGRKALTTLPTVELACDEDHSTTSSRKWCASDNEISPSDIESPASDRPRAKHEKER
ncbi:hypothetical protein HII31_09020 [Pseudocercospora fuligena]|uniref:DUF1593-domain-containing protein n=1 Tax=Pseudocercospora fuligena TaxID=685502 RepID=A0A8H6VFP0_9PEZI|nr:hypothetical protein HII31_09020 [Pseudocercospora fuligena]